MTFENILTIITLLCGSGVLVGVGRYFHGKIRAIEQKNEAVCLGVQALLRDRLIESYNRHIDNGYAPIYAKENFDNMYKQYHNLGVNGVMDELHSTFMELPTRPTKKEGCNE